MAKTYPVTLQDDTIAKVKKLLNIGTKTDEKYIISSDGFYKVEDFLEYETINVTSGGYEVDINKTEPALITTNGLHRTIEVGKVEREGREVTTIGGHEYTTVRIPASKYITSANLSCSISAEPTHENDHISVAAINTEDGYAYNEHKIVGLNVWADEANTEAAVGKVNLGVTEDSCIAHYNTDVVKDYKHLSDLRLLAITESEEDAEFDLHISGKVRTENGLKVYPVGDAMLTSEHFHVTLAELNRLLAVVGYEIVEK